MIDLSRRPHKSVEVPLGKMCVSERAQRALKPHRVAELLAKLDLTALGEPILSARDGRYYIIDGQHRKHALAEFLGHGWEEQKISCRVYEGMTEQDEADLFDQVNNVLPVSVFDKFKIRVTAGRETETRIKAAVEAAGLAIARGKGPGQVGAVSALRRVYDLAGPETLTRALRIITQSFGDAGLESTVIEGVGHLCHRYNGTLDDAQVIDSLSHVRGGVKGLLNQAATLRLQTGNSRAVCVAARAVEAINGTRKGGKKLPSWWAVSAG